MTTADVPLGQIAAPSRTVDKTSGRLLHLDACKGMLIVLVLFGHSIQFFSYANGGDFWSDPVFKFIYMFHMPLFAAYSGYFSPRRAVMRQDVMKRIVTLIAPMIVWVMIGYCLHVAIAPESGRSLLGVFKDMLVGRYWFIWAIFFSLAACWLCESVLRLPRLGYAAIFLALLLQSSGSDSIAKFDFIFPYFVAGRLLRIEPRLADFAGANRGAMFALAAAGTAVAYRYWTHDTYIYNNQLQTLTMPADVALMLVGSTCATIFAAIVIDCIARRIVDGLLGRVFQRIGVVTMELYLLQSIFFAEASTLAKPYLGPEGATLGARLGLAFAVCALSLVLMMGVIALTRRSEMIGKALWGR